MAAFELTYSKQLQVAMAGAPKWRLLLAIFCWWISTFKTARISFILMKRTLEKKPLYLVRTLVNQQDHLGDDWIESSMLQIVRRILHWRSMITARQGGHSQSRLSSQHPTSESCYLVFEADASVTH